MKTVDVTIRGVTQYQQGAYVATEKEAGETGDAHEERTWRERMHVDADGNVYIPGQAFKKAIDEAVSWLGRKIRGKGQSTYTKRFLRGVAVLSDVPIGAKASDAIKVRLHVGAQGANSEKRVFRNFPTFPKWGGVVEFHVFDDLIDKVIFQEAMEAAGKFIGVGVFRPERGGTQGRFEVEKIEFRGEWA